MNVTKIEWTDWTINPVVGCTHGCEYCYARRMAMRRGKETCCYNFRPHFHPERLDQINPNQRPKKIFLDSMWDWNCQDNRSEWTRKILKKMWQCPQHTFQILSKEPIGYARFNFPPNTWLGTSVTRNADSYRMSHMDMAVPGAFVRFVSIEPILERVKWKFSDMDWVIVGAETGNRKGKVIPKKVWIGEIIDRCAEENIPLFIKDNVKWPEVIREFPRTKKAT